MKSFDGIPAVEEGSVVQFDPVPGYLEHVLGARPDRGQVDPVAGVVKVVSPVG